MLRQCFPPLAPAQPVPPVACSLPGAVAPISPPGSDFTRMNKRGHSTDRLRPQTDRMAARHPCASDAFPLQPSFIWVGRGCYRFAARTVGWTRYEGEKNGEENSRRAVAGVGCCLCPCGCVGSLHWLPPSSPRLRSPLPSLLPVIPAATPTAEPFPAVGSSSFGANPDFCTCGRNDYDGGFGSRRTKAPCRPSRPQFFRKPTLRPPCKSQTFCIIA